ncbi:MAG TPA: hypothetical protein VM597_10975 [Gemmataceae bacterium]|jgi:hypothetical protein|nr:hypothetical protein [Gemmataceae bacterium]
MDRRVFLAASLAATAGRSAAQPAREKPETINVPAAAVTTGPKHHWFGYYDKTPWDATGRYLLAMEADFCDRQPQPGEAVRVGMVDLTKDGEFIPLARTAAW